MVDEHGKWPIEYPEVRKAQALARFSFESEWRRRAGMMELLRSPLRGIRHLGESVGYKGKWIVTKLRRVNTF